MINFYFKSKNTTFGLFLAHFPFFFFFEDKKCFPKKTGMHNLIRFSSNMLDWYSWIGGKMKI